MTETKFTPGPWRLADDYDNALHICSPWSSNVRPESSDTYGSCLGAHICQVRHQGEDAPVVKLSQAKANAHLIAAAPELYEALKRGLKALSFAVEHAGGDPETHYCCVQMRAALAKARGES